MVALERLDEDSLRALSRTLEWRLGALQDLRTLEQDYIQAPHERAGQIGGGPPGQFNSPKREQRQSREREHSERFLDQAIEAAATLAEERGWERILVSGGDRMTEAAISRFPQQLRDIVFADARVLSGLDDNALATTVTDWAHEQHGEREGQLLSRCTVVLVIRARYNAARTLAAARSPEDTAPSI